MILIIECVRIISTCSSILTISPHLAFAHKFAQILSYILSIFKGIVLSVAFVTDLCHVILNDKHLYATLMIAEN